MLTDISNDLKVHGTSAARNQRDLQQRNSALRPLRIVNRRFLRKATGENSVPTDRNNAKTINNSNSKVRTLFNPYSNNSSNKMLDSPSYKFPRIFEEETDILFPFYNCRIEREQKNLKANEVKLDFTNDLTFHKNITKKYSKPVEVEKLVPRRLFKDDSTQQPTLAFNIFFRGDNDTSADPVMDTFMHMKSENQLRFGEYLLTIGKDGSVSSKYTPIDETEDAFLVSGRPDEQDFNDEVLYRSDEGEVSRLENSDLDITESEESEVELDLELELKDEEDEALDGNFSISNSSLISQSVPSYAIDNLQNGFLTNDKKSKSSATHMPPSPLKRAVANHSHNSSSASSPQKQELLFRTLKNKSSPIKALKSQRSGVNLTQVCKPKKHKHTNYAKWDNSMTISAKAIMKMVDDSLVSSDTELYNHSCSFMTVKSFSKCNQTGAKGDININAADLMGALSGEVDSPLTRRMRELKLQ